MGVRKLLFILACALLPAACADSPARLPIVSPDASLGATHPIIVATSRTPQPDPVRPFGDGRSDNLSCETVNVWTPKDRKAGAVTYPSKKPKIARQFAATAIEPFDCDALTDTLNERLRNADAAAERIGLVFVHGYNVDYAEGLYHQAQFIEDFRINAVAVQYSWPSAGRFIRYLYDRDSATFARDGLVRVLNDAAASDAESIIVLAHSMGALITMEAIRQLDQSGRTDTLSRIKPLILASPDIDVDVFRAQMAALSHPPAPIVVFASQRDKALWFSDRLRGGHARVGEGKDIDTLRRLGVTVVDFTPVDDGDSANHSVFPARPPSSKWFMTGR